MKIMNRLTINNLKLNKRRTLVTIIGIILSTVLITLVVGLAASFYKSLTNLIIDITGNFHVEYIDIDKNDLKYISNHRNIDSYFTTNSLGIAYVAQNNSARPYLHIYEYDDKALENLIHIKEGRLPENEHELVIQETLIDYGANYKIGDEITLLVGKRAKLDGTLISDDEIYLGNVKAAKFYDSDVIEENLVDVVPYTYKIVGIISEMYDPLEPYDGPSYTTITYKKNIDSDNINVFVNYKDPKKYLEHLCEMSTDNNEEKDKCLTKKEYKQTSKYIVNDELLGMLGADNSDTTNKLLITVVAIIIMVVVITSVFVIKSSFNISIIERYKQYGILKSIGATSKQIRKSVVFEGLILGMIAIPIGIILGILTNFLLVNIVNFIVKDIEDLSSTGQILWFDMPLIGIVIAVLISSMTILLSSLLPAIKASKITPIEAIRNNKDITNKKGKIKSSKIIKKVFGIEGVIADNNLKRNRKKYRTTIVSIVISIVMFITLSEVVEYEFNAMLDHYKELNYNGSVDGFCEVSDNAAIDDYECVNKIIEQYDAIIKQFKEKNYTYGKGVDVEVPYKYFSDEYLNTYKKELTPEEYQDVIDNKLISNSVPLIVFSNQEFKRLSDGYSLTEDDYKNGFLLYNIEVMEDEEKITKVKLFKFRENENIEILKNNKKYQLKVIGETKSKKSMYPYNSTGEVSLMVSEEFAKNHPELFVNYDFVTGLYLNTDKSSEIENYVYNIDEQNFGMYYENVEQVYQEMKSFTLICNIFVYGFIIMISFIGVTNIFNVITTNMLLRSREFASLSSIGMTNKQLNKMIRLESILYGFKALVIGIGISLIISYAFYTKVQPLLMLDGYRLPITEITICIIAVLGIVYITMRYSLNKIKKQNIIDTIRNDNI